MANPLWLETLQHNVNPPLNTKRSQSDLSTKEVDHEDGESSAGLLFTAGIATDHDLLKNCSGGDRLNRKRLSLIILVAALVLLIVYTSVSDVLLQAQLAAQRVPKISVSWRSTLGEPQSVNGTSGQCGTYVNSVFTPSNCVYMITGAYSNTGQDATTSTTISFNFWVVIPNSQTGIGKIGQLVCRKDLNVGSVPGGSLTLLPEPLDCQSSTSTYGAFTNSTWT